MFICNFRNILIHKKMTLQTQFRAALALLEGLGSEAKDSPVQVCSDQNKTNPQVNLSLFSPTHLHKKHVLGMYVFRPNVFRWIYKRSASKYKLNHLSSGRPATQLYLSVESIGFKESVYRYSGISS